MGYFLFQKVIDEENLKQIIKEEYLKETAQNG